MVRLEGALLRGESDVRIYISGLIAGTGAPPPIEGRISDI